MFRISGAQVYDVTMFSQNTEYAMNKTFQKCDSVKF
jgi:hypothetical protein